MTNDSELGVSKYVSYLLRHNPEDLEMDDEGFVNLDELVSRVKRRYPTVSKSLLTKIVDQSERKRFEIRGSKIRALYGHTVEVHVKLMEDEQVARLYHGTTPLAVRDILEKGLLPMGRRWAHLSPTENIAWEVGKRRTNMPIVLEIDASAARRDGTTFYKATDKVYVCENVPPKYIKLPR